MTADSFTLRDGIEIGILLIAILAYLLDRRKDRETAKRLSENALRDGFAAHEQNCLKLQNLEDFNRRQSGINEKRDKQITQLMAQTTTLTEIAKGMDRRLEMLEDKC